MECIHNLISRQRDARPTRNRTNVCEKQGHCQPRKQATSGLKQAFQCCDVHLSPQKQHCVATGYICSFTDQHPGHKSTSDTLPPIHCHIPVWLSLHHLQCVQECLHGISDPLRIAHLSINGQIPRFNHCHTNWAHRLYYLDGRFYQMMSIERRYPVDYPDLRPETFQLCVHAAISIQDLKVYHKFTLRGRQPCVRGYMSASPAFIRNEIRDITTEIRGPWTYTRSCEMCEADLICNVFLRKSGTMICIEATSFSALGAGVIADDAVWKKAFTASESPCRPASALSVRAKLLSVDSWTAGPQLLENTTPSHGSVGSRNEDDLSSDSPPSYKEF